MRNYIILGVVFVAAIVVVVFGFRQYDNSFAIGAQDLGGNTAAAASAVSASACKSDPIIVQAINTYNSIMLPYAVAPVTTSCPSPTIVAAIKTTGLATSTFSYNGGGMNAPQPSNACYTPISVAAANHLVKDLSNHGINAGFLTSTSSLYVFWPQSAIQPIGDRLYKGLAYTAVMGSNPFYNSYGVPTVGYCLDQGYISNYSNFVTKFIAFARSQPYPPQNMTAFLSGNGDISASIVSAVAGSLLQASTSNAVN